MYVMRGFGDAAQIVQTGGTLAAPVAAGAVAAASATSVAAGGSALILGMAPALAIPLVGAAVVGVTLAIVAILHSGCGKSCIITSDWANKAADLLQKNLDAYRALPVPRSRTAQAACLANFDSIWNYLVQECSDPNLGDAGKNCIADRQAGACKWKNADGCFDWFKAYRDPIANDPNVVDDSVAAQVSEAVTSSVNVGGASIPVWGLLAAAVALYFVVKGS